MISPGYSVQYNPGQSYGKLRRLQTIHGKDIVKCKETYVHMNKSVTIRGNSERLIKTYQTYPVLKQNNQNQILPLRNVLDLVELIKQNFLVTWRLETAIRYLYIK